MSNPNTIINAYVSIGQELVSNLEQLRLYNTILAQDPTIITRYFDNVNNPSHRTDIVAADVANQQSAVVQMLVPFDTGSPPQKAFFFKMQP